MESPDSNPPEAATDEPASPPTLPAPVAPFVSEALPDRFADALAAAVQPRPGPAPRYDGWTPARIRKFLVSLSEGAIVSRAAEAAGISIPSAYRFRNRAAGRAFNLAWEAAVILGRRRLADEVAARAMHGCVEIIIRDGKVWGERHRFDNRLAMSVLSRLDNRARGEGREGDVIRFVAEEFDQFLELVCAGDQEAADRFVYTRGTG